MLVLWFAVELLEFEDLCFGGKGRALCLPQRGKQTYSVHLSFSFLSMIFDRRNDIYKMVIYREYSGKGMGKCCWRRNYNSNTWVQLFTTINTARGLKRTIQTLSSARLATNGNPTTLLPQAAAVTRFSICGARPVPFIPFLSPSAPYARCYLSRAIHWGGSSVKSALQRLCRCKVSYNTTVAVTL